MLRECEPCGLLIQMAYLTQGKDVRSGGATCASREVGRTALGAVGLKQNRVYVLQYRQGFGFITF